MVTLNRESEQYRGNEMPCWRSGLPECSCDCIIKLLLQMNNNTIAGYNLRKHVPFIIHCAVFWSHVALKPGTVNAENDEFCMPQV